MAIRACYLCDQDPVTKRHYGNGGLADGVNCPICYQATCRYHLTTVRWRWLSDREVEAGLICKECKRSYAHRNWDAVNRDWIS